MFRVLALCQSKETTTTKPWLTLETSANKLFTAYSTYPHQPHVDTFCTLPLRRRRPKLVLTGGHKLKGEVCL